MAGKPGHGGQKGRSGRKPLLEEQAIEQILQVSTSILYRWLSNDKVPVARKIPIIRDIFLKRLPMKIESDSPPATVKVFVQNIIHKAGIDDGKREAAPSNQQVESRLS